MERTILGAVFFLAFFGVLLTAYFGSSSYVMNNTTSPLFFNQTNANVTITNQASNNLISPPPTCTFTDNPFSNFLSGAVCLGNELGWFIGLMVLGSPIAWLGALLLAIGAVIAILVLKMIRGN